MPTEIEIFGRLALAFGIGIAIGIERGWRTREAEKGSRALGVRTLALIGLFGGGVGLLGQLTSDIVVAVGLAGIMVFLTAVYFTGLQHSDDRGATTEVAAAFTFVLGIVAVRGDMTVAAAAAVLTVAVLDLKQPLHSWLKQIDAAELRAAIKLLVISVVMLPVLPNRGYGPGAILNPYVMWWIVVAISAISFAAYAAIRMFGARSGALGVGLLGGLASSTATTITFARLIATSPKLTHAAAGGMAVASAVMFARALVLMGIFYADALRLLLVPLVASAIAAFAVGLVLARHDIKTRSDADVALGAPSDIGTGIKFMVAMMVIALATHYGQDLFGQTGALAAAAAGGLVDIDATTVTMSRLGAAGTVPSTEVVAGIFMAVLVNSLAKGTYATVIAGRSFVRFAALIFALPAGLGIALYVFMT